MLLYNVSLYSGKNHLSLFKFSEKPFFRSFVSPQKIIVALNFLSLHKSQDKNMQYLLIIVFLITMITPYMLYTWAFKRPKSFLAHMSQDNLVTVSSILHAITIVIYTVFCFESGFNKNGLIFSIPCISIGQFLNYQVYSKLGKVRAYYGWELDLDNGPQVQGFPFTLKDPQYKGCLLTLLGVFLMFKTSAQLLFTTVSWALMYVYMIIMENTPSGKVIKSE